MFKDIIEAIFNLGVLILFGYAIIFLLECFVRILGHITIIIH